MAKAQIAYPRGLTFEQVWAALMEDREQMKANDERLTKQLAANDERLAKQQAANDERLAKQQAANDERLAKQMAETERSFKATQEWLAEQQAETERSFKATQEWLAEQLAETERASKASQEWLTKKMAETDAKISKLGSRFGEAVEFMVKPNLISKFNELGFAFTKIYHETEIKDKANNIFTEIDLTLEDGDTVMIVEVKSKPSSKDIKDHIERMEKVRRHADLHGHNRKYFGAVAGLVVNDNVRDYALKNGFYVVEPSGDTFNIIVPEGDCAPREW